MDWFKRFKDGREPVDDDPRSVRPSTSTDGTRVTKVNEIVRINRRLTVREIAENCNIPVGPCREILVVKLEMYSVAAEFVPRSMSQDQMDNRVTVCQGLVDRARMAMKCSRKQIHTGDETWVYGRDVQTKVRSSRRVGKCS